MKKKYETPVVKLCVDVQREVQTRNHLSWEEAYALASLGWTIRWIGGKIANFCNRKFDAGEFFYREYIGENYYVGSFPDMIRGAK